MVWFCAKLNNLKGKKLCGRYLEKIILVYALTKAELNIDDYPCYLKHSIECDSLMYLLDACKIANLDGNPYSFQSQEAKNEIDEAWKQLIRSVSSKKYLMLGRIPKAKVPDHNRGESHIMEMSHSIEVDRPIVARGDIREPDYIEEAGESEERVDRVVGHIVVCGLSETAESVRIYDPQNKQDSFDLNQEGFRNYVINDGGLEIYAVDWEKLKEIIVWHKRIIDSDCKHK
jgi:hypothetical protein